jgi:plastocyanin
MKRLLLAAASLLAACATIQPAPGGGFEIVPASANASPGGVVRLVASVALGAPPVTWTATGGTITPAGVLTVPGCAASLPVTVTVTATSGTTVATSTVNVADTVTGITVSPSTVNVAPGGTVQFTSLVKTVCFPAGSASNMQLKRPKNGGPATIEAIAAAK